MLGWPEAILVFAVLVLVFGPSKLPEIARALGSAMKEFRKASSELEQAVQGLEDPLAAKSRAQQVVATPVVPQSVASSGPLTPGVASPRRGQDSALVDIAMKLGIDTEGKSEDQIKSEIIERAGSSVTRA